MRTSDTFRAVTAAALVSTLLLQAQAPLPGQQQQQQEQEPAGARSRSSPMAPQPAREVGEQPGVPGQPQVGGGGGVIGSGGIYGGLTLQNVPMCTCWPNTVNCLAR